LKHFLRILQKILQVICWLIVIWFGVYFFFGERFSITFTNRDFGEYLPHILTFGAAASIYLLLILNIKSSRKKWRNILFFFLGLILAAVPLLAFHLYFQYQCEFWNREIKSSKVIYFNKLNKFESIKVIRSVCENEKSKVQTDTAYSKQITPYFELQNPVKIEKSDSGTWTAKNSVQE
jgi:hypothetical protein